MWHYSRITTDTLYSSQGLLRVLHCTAAPSVTVMPVDRGLLEVEDQTEAPSTNESRAASISQAPCQSLLTCCSTLCRAQFSPPVVLRGPGGMTSTRDLFVRMAGCRPCLYIW